MKMGSIRNFASVALCVAVLGGVAFAAQDRYSLKIPDGLAFSDFRGYDGWQTVATSATEDSIKVILANPTMIAAYKSGIPGNGKPFPEGSKVAKIEWAKVKNAESPYFVEIPGNLKTLAFIEKDTKRFPDTHGWAYAQWAYDPKTDAFKPNAPIAATGHVCGYACHTVVAKKDYIFTAFPKR
jgi:hypothetical protein